MIEIKNLTKIYAKNRRQQCVALDDVSFTLPDKGMVFIVGKSGCGKSTLLNVLGGLDKLTSGDVVVDGVAFSTFSEGDFGHYRNGYLGFIFQDYCLIESLTVEQNVALSLQLKGIDDANAVREALAKVDLESFADRYSKDLSGGQKQRVAIARALIKNPKIILADEPTGNLDGKSSHQILTRLKELAASRLVVVVSHNMQDANEFADRIIELSDGKIVNDLQRNPDAIDVSIGAEETVFQQGTVFTDEQLSQINEKINARQRGTYSIKQVSDKFVAVVPRQSSDTKPLSMSSVKGISRNYARRLFATFTKKRIVSLVLTTLLVISLVVILGVCQLFTQFDADREIGKILRESNDGAFIMQKGYVSNDIFHTVQTNVLTRVTEQDVQAFYDNGYNGNVFPLYNAALIANNALDYDLESYRNVVEAYIYANFYAREGLGVLCCTRQYLESIYANDSGELEVLSGEIDDKSMGIIITDYFADSILYFSVGKYNPLGLDPYADITSAESVCDRYKVAAVINTHYKERYADVIDAYRENNLTGPDSPTDLLNEFFLELNSSLNVAYTFNKDYLATMLRHEAGFKGFSHLTNPTWTLEDGTSANFVLHCYRDMSGLIENDNQIILNKEMYCSITGVDVPQDNLEYWNSVIGTKITITNYDTTQTEGEPLFIWKDMEIVGLLDGTGVGFRVSENRLLEAKKYDTFAYKLYFDNPNGVLAAYEVGEQRNFVAQSPLFTAVYSVAQAVEIFVDFFMLIVVAMYVLCAAVLVAFVVGGIKKNIYEIGVLRALGARTRDLALIFSVQMLIVGIAVCLLSTLALGLGCGAVNDMLVDGFVSVTHNTLIKNLDVIAFRWSTMLINAGLVLALTLASSTAPFVLLRYVKPREIIRAKE